MSLQALHWALDEAPDVPPHLVSCLLGMANHADDQGRGVYLSWATLARYTRKTERAVSRDLRQLEELGLIRRGDQRFVAHLSPDRRPVVYDLAMERKRPPAPPPKPRGRPSKNRDDAHDTPNRKRGDVHVKTGCRPRQNGVTSTSPEPSLNLGRTFLPSEAGSEADFVGARDQAGRSVPETQTQTQTRVPNPRRSRANRHQVQEHPAAAELVDGLEWPGVISRARITASRRNLITAAASALAAGHHPDAVRATAQEAMPGAETPGAVVARLRDLATRTPDPAVAAAAEREAVKAERERMANTSHQYEPARAGGYCARCLRPEVHRVHREHQERVDQDQEPAAVRSEAPDTGQAAPTGRCQHGRRVCVTCHGGRLDDTTTTSTSTPARPAPRQRPATGDGAMSTLGSVLAEMTATRQPAGV